MPIRVTPAAERTGRGELLDEVAQLEPPRDPTGPSVDPKVTLLRELASKSHSSSSLSSHETEDAGVNVFTEGFRAAASIARRRLSAGLMSARAACVLSNIEKERSEGGELD